MTQLGLPRRPPSALNIRRSSKCTTHSVQSEYLAAEPSLPAMTVLEGTRLHRTLFFSAQPRHMLRLGSSGMGKAKEVPPRKREKREEEIAHWGVRIHGTASGIRNPYMGLQSWLKHLQQLSDPIRCSPSLSSGFSWWMVCQSLASWYRDSTSLHTNIWLPNSIFAYQKWLFVSP